MTKKKKKILFFGTPKIAIPSLEIISKLKDYEIISVGVFPDRKIGRKQILKPCAVKEKALELELKIKEINNKNELENFIKKTNFDLAIVIAFGMIFPASILSSNKFINIHFSLLPKYRGASPVQSAILNNETKSGITWQIMSEKLDSGDILFQKTYNISNKKTSDVWQDFAQKTALEFPNFLNNFFTQKLKKIPQNNSKASFCYKFKKEDGKINLKTMTASQIYQKFCAFDVWPGIFIKTSKGNIKLCEISLKKSPISSEIICKDNSKLFLEKIQIPGKKIANALDVFRGNENILKN